MNVPKINPKAEDFITSLRPIDVRSQLFRKRNFDFIVNGTAKNGVNKGNIGTHEKQKQALEILTANEYEEFLYGGAAGGAKSFTGAVWLLFMCINYPGTRYFVARNELKDILESVYVTFVDVCKMFGFTDYKYNGVKNFIQFGNGSYINLIEIKYKPSDPMFEDLGSTEYTAGWMEEIGEAHKQAYIVLRTRIGRYKNDEYGIKKMMFMTCNPKKNWAKIEFYDKDKAGTLESHKKYLQCLIVENPFLTEDYVGSMRRLAEEDKATFERLFKGNWDYEENPNALCEYEMIEQVYDNDHVQEGKAYLTADIARLGSDKAVIFVWKGWKVVDMVSYDVSKTTELQNRINLLRRKYGIPKNRCIADEDGIGGGVVDNTGILGFKNNGTPIKEKGDMPNYRNLQVQCLYHLADRVNEAQIWIDCDLNYQEKEHIKEELDQIQSSLSDYGKHDCKRKSEIKADIGRSPDYRDALLMRVYFDLKPTRRMMMRSVPRDRL